MNNYLTEKKLGTELKKIFPEHNFIHDKVVPSSGVKTRPDYRNDDLKLIVEFDGDQHYRSASKIKKELTKNNNYGKMGYKVVRIPYFIQLCKPVIKHLFNVEFEYDQDFPHGFISDKAILPADYCELGILKFINDLKRFEYLNAEIIKSLEEKVEKHKDIELVIPVSLKYLITN